MSAASGVPQLGGAGRLARSVAAGMALVLTASVAGGPADAATSGTVQPQPEPAAAQRWPATVDGPTALRGIAAGLRLQTGRPPRADRNWDSCVHQQTLVVGDGVYLNGRSQTIQWTPGTGQQLVVDREIWLRPAPTGAQLDGVIRESAGSGWWRPSISAFGPLRTPMAVLASDAGTAAQQLAASVQREPGRLSADDLVQAALAVARAQYLDGLQRAALLEVLATVPGVLLDGHRTDLAGRPGLAFRFVSSPDQLTVIIDGHSGEILTAITVWTALDIGGPAQFNTLYLQRRQCPPTGWTWEQGWPERPENLFCCGGVG